MLLVSLGSIAIAITALGGTSIYGWLFLGSLVVSGLCYVIFKQRLKSFEAQIQSKRQLSINFIKNEYETTLMNYNELVKPYENTEIKEIQGFLKCLSNDEKNITTLYNDTIHSIETSQDLSDLESIKNQFTNPSQHFQQNVAIQTEKIKECLKKEEIKNQKLKFINDSKSEHF